MAFRNRNSDDVKNDILISGCEPTKRLDAGRIAMLMALLFNSDDQIAAAAPACDQVPYGDRYWFEYHEANVDSGETLRTAYIMIADPDLQARLMMAGIDETIDGQVLAQAIESQIAPDYLSPKAA